MQNRKGAVKNDLHAILDTFPPSLKHSFFFQKIEISVRCDYTRRENYHALARSSSSRRTVFRCITGKVLTQENAVLSIFLDRKQHHGRGTFLRVLQCVQCNNVTSVQAAKLLAQQPKRRRVITARYLPHGCHFKCLGIKPVNSGKSEVYNLIYLLLSTLLDKGWKCQMTRKRQDKTTREN